MSGAYTAELIAILGEWIRESEELIEVVRNANACIRGDAEFIFCGGVSDLQALGLDNIRRNTLYMDQRGRRLHDHLDGWIDQVRDLAFAIIHSMAAVPTETVAPSGQLLGQGTEEDPYIVPDDE